MINNDTFDRIIAFENGELEFEEVEHLFADLVESGLVFQLQGSYMRSAIQLGFGPEIQQRWGVAL